MSGYVARKRRQVLYAAVTLICFFRAVLLSIICRLFFQLRCMLSFICKGMVELSHGFLYSTWNMIQLYVCFFCWLVDTYMAADEDVRVITYDVGVSLLGRLSIYDDRPSIASR